ncbi:Uncharacterised protein [Legionella lansingensis]|uniref:Uncharacterized protein n=1 Tax=Legionella lansingensis TaxID=45067 RepID=A0A0W0W0J6_9GAMM|nr:hypothetical protein [Legionella lansingensis]KTD25793.1 hypothetical protein Llan_0062 [Legionella lansingensis]SNV52189.1 Uncharacterised protein [Legionella lansingensis]
MKYFFRAIQFIQKNERVEIPGEGGGLPVVHITHLNGASYERDGLRTTDPLERSTLPTTNSVQSWFEGKMGHSTTRYNPGQRYYYSPVGYVYGIENDNDVLANFKSDGNIGQTCTLDFKDTNDLTVIQRVCKAIADNEEIQTLLATQKEYKDFFETVRANAKTIDDLNGRVCINGLLSEYTNKSALGKKLRSCIREAAHGVLKEYYKKTGNSTRYCESGLSPAAEFTQAEGIYKTLKPGSEGAIGKKLVGGGLEDDKGKYTESVVHGRADNLYSVFASMDTEAIPYPELIDAKFVIKDASAAGIKTVLKERLRAMLALQDKLKEVKKDLKFGVIDQQGVLYTTTDKEHVEELILLCSSKKTSLTTLDEKIKEHFTPVEAPPVSEAQVWETGHDEEIVIIKDVSEKRKTHKKESGGYGFFSKRNIGLAAVAVVAAVTIGVVVSRNRGSS